METVFATRNFLGVSEFIPNQLYFAVCRNIPCSTDIIGNEEFNFFCIDDKLVYSNYYGDFGPLNVLALYKFSEMLLEKLGHYGGEDWCKLYGNSIFFNICKAEKLAAKFTRQKVIVFYTKTSNELRANAAFLIGAFAIIYMGYSPCLVSRILNPHILPYRNFQDAVLGLSPYTISIKDCLDAVFNAAVFGFFDFNDFNYEEFIYHDFKQHGHVNWILPGKLVALPGPVNCCESNDPMQYVNYFRLRNVTDIVALSAIEYDKACFENNGIRHHCLYIAQGEVPTNCDIKAFFQIVECATGAVAVHCKAGLGRTGTVIAAYLIKHYKLTAREAISWVRICRPGSVLGNQQKWLECKEREFISLGNCFREQNYGDCNKILCHSQGIYNYCVPSHIS